MGLFSSSPTLAAVTPPPPLPGATPPVAANPQMMAAMARRTRTDPTDLTTEPGLLTSNQAKARVAQAQLGGGQGSLAGEGAAGPGIAASRVG